MSFTSLPSEDVAILGVIDPDANGVATLTSDYGDMSKFEAAMAIISVGAMLATSTVDAKLVQATDSSGTGAKDITGKAITQLTAAGSDDDKQAVINVRAEDLDIDNDFTHVAISMTTGTAGSDSAAILLGFNPIAKPASDNDLASVDEIV